MNREDFDIASLARYLHLSPAQVQKLVDRELIPARRIAGAWRFSSDEVHHWLEERLSAGGSAELDHVQAVLTASHPAVQASLGDLLTEEAIACPLAARTRSSVVDSMVDVAMQTGLLWDAGKMADAVRVRENLHSTALANGVALLHPRRPMPQILGDSFIALGRTSAGIPFGGERGELTDLFFLICALDDATHLHILALLSRLVIDTATLAKLREANTPRDVLQVIQSASE